MSTNSFKEISDIPGSAGLPYFGDFFSFLHDASGFLERRRQQYGNVFKFKTPVGASVVLCGPTANKFILLEKAKFTTNREAWENTLSDLFPNGLMLMDGERHQYHRSIMNEAFRKNPMQGYLDIMPEIIAEGLKELDGKKKVLLFPFYKRLTLKLAARVFFGLELQEDLTKINTAITDIVNAAMALPINLPFTKYRKGINARAYLVSYFQSIIQEKRDNPSKDLFSRLCQATSEEGHQFSDQEIIDHLIFVLMAAHDTTAITLSWMSYFMAKHPQWQEKARKEAQQIDMFDNIQISDLRQMEQTGLVMKETLRIHPPLIMLLRKLEQDLEVEGYMIPKNTVVNLIMQITHQDKEVWTNPKKFDPERFNMQRREELKCPFAYAPFGGGKHHCIGFSFAEMQVKLVMSELLKRYQLRVAEGYECAVQDVPLKVPKDGLPVFLEKIH